MATPFDSVATLSERELLDHFHGLVDRDCRTTAELLVAIAEIDERKIWAKHGCSSMFAYCVERFHMSEQVAAKRLWAARTARRFPVILPLVERGELHLAAIHLLAGHLTAENHARVLERAKHKTSREVERLVAELAPRADVPSRIRALPTFRQADAQAGGPSGAGSGDAASASSNSTSVSSDAASADHDEDAGISDQRRVADREVVGFASGALSRTSESGATTKPIVPLSPRRYKIEITVDEATHDKLRSLQDLLGRSATGRDPAAIISRAIDVLLDRTLARRAGCTDRPRPTNRQFTDRTGSLTGAASQRGPRTRTIPAAVRREVWQRDSGRCCYVNPFGRRCAAASNVEFHHRKPFAAGGGPTAQNIELRCAAHNQYQADLDFGRSFMDGRRGTAAPTFPGGMSEDAGFSVMRGRRARKEAPTFPGGMSGTQAVP